MLTMLNKVGNNAYQESQFPYPDTNLNFDDSWIDDAVFSYEVRSFLDTFSVHIYPDTCGCLFSLNDGQTPGYISFISFLDDPLSMPLNLNLEADRLTYMMYYWNVINYFFPYKAIMDQPWDTTLYQFIPQFREAPDATRFHIAFLKMATKINDTHGYTSSSIIQNNFWGGAYLPKVNLVRAEDQCVVDKVDGMDGVLPGDILVEMKGIPLEEIADSLIDYIPASNPASFYRELYFYMLFGGYNTPLEFTFSDRYGNLYNVNTTRNMSFSSWHGWLNEDDPDSSYFITDCDYGYVDMGLLQPAEVPAMYDYLKDAPAIIFDLRNYPNGTLWDLGPLLFENPVVSAVFYVPALKDYYNPLQPSLPGWYDIYNDSLNLGQWFNPDAYDGNVYILVNEETQSQAEYTCQYFSYHPNATVIGTQTSGADGNVSYLNLPGNLRTTFTSLGWYYADGYQQQRNGVKIDTVVSPTLEGIREGKDEILLAALDCLTGVKERLFAGERMILYPNPAGRTLTIDIQGAGQTENHEAACISITNLLGNEVLRAGDFSSFPARADISALPDGIYILKVTGSSGTLRSEKFVKITK
jgi:hypothetical protein